MSLEICFWLSVHLFIRFPIACVPLASKPCGLWCMADMTLPKDKTGTLLPAVPGPRPATDFTQTSSSWAVEGSSPWPQHPQAHLCQAPQPLFCILRGKRERGFGLWGFRQVTLATKAMIHMDVSMPSFRAVLIGGKIPLGWNQFGIVVSKAAFSEIKHFSPVV